MMWSAAILSAALTAGAKLILAVDIETLPTDTTQTNFTQMVVGDQTVEVTRVVIGNYTVSIAGGSSTNCFIGAPHLMAYNSRDRINNVKTAGSFLQVNLIDLLRERVAVWGGSPIDPAIGKGTGPGLYLMVEGLEPRTIYTLQAWAVDHVKNSAVLRNGYVYGFDATFEEKGYSSLPLLGTYTISGSPETIEDNSQYSITGTMTSDSRGRIIYKTISNLDGCGLLNGFTLNYVGPVVLLGKAEPASSADNSRAL